VTGAPDASRAAIRRRRVVFPRRTTIVDLFAHHLTQDARILEEDPATGTQSYKYIRTGENHFSLALTYPWLSASDPKKLSSAPFTIEGRIRQRSGIDFGKTSPCRLRTQHAGSPEAASIKAAATSWSRRQARRGELWGQKTAVLKTLPLFSR